MDVTHSPVPELPTRRFCSLDVKPALDADGFLSDSTKRTSGVDELLAGAATLVVAPPWTGKTFVARRIQAHFRITNDGPGVSEAKNTFAEFNHFALFEEAAVSVLPPWWQQWKDGDGRALWLIDALDEDLRTGGLRTDEVLKCLAETKKKELGRLTLVLLCREAELPKKVRDKLQQLLPSLATVRLAPLTRVEAVELLGGQRTFDRVSHTIERNNLQGLAGLPATLLALQDLGDEAEISPAVVWRRVLERLLHHERESDTEHSLGVDPPMDDRFDVAGRVAAILLMAGEDELARDVIQSTAPLLEDIIPKTTPQYERLRVAARAVRRTAVLQQTADGYRFAQQHVQEWFAAFALRNIKLSRVRPLVCDDTGQLSKHLLGLLGNLHEISNEREVREWLVCESGGLAPRSDSMPWTMKQAIAALDRIQEHAKQTEFGLNPLSLDGVDRLDTPGMGPEIARRLLDKSLTAGERRLMVDLASEIKPPGIADALEQVIADGTAEIHLRVSCGLLLRNIGSREHYRRLKSFATDITLTSDQENRLRSLVVLGLYEFDEWSFVKAAAYAPPCSEHVFDARSLLRAVLKEKMTLTDARRLLKRSPPAGWPAQVRRGPSEPSLRVHALQLVAGQDKLSRNDYELLIPLVFRSCPPAGLGPHHQLVAVFRKSRNARRKLFAKGMQVDTSDEAPEFGWWRWTLAGEDVEWLKNFVTNRSEQPPWLLDVLLSLAYTDGVSRPILLGARKLVRALNPDFMKKFDRDRKRGREQRRRFEREQDEQRRAESQNQMSVSEAARQILASKLTLQQQMWQFGRTCFASEQTRPHNLIGEWGDLSPEVKAQVLATCERALGKCTATPVPVGTSYPGAVIYESYVFQAVLYSSRSYRLDAEQIDRWLQSALIFMRSEHGSTIERCAEVDKSATELVLLREMRRTMSTDESYVGAVIPTELWSPGLIDATFHLIRDDSLPTQGRSHLLRVVARHAREPAVGVAKQWLSGEQAGNTESKAAALDVLLMWDPSDALDRLEPIVASDATALFDLRTIASRGDRSLIDLDRWPIEAAEQLANLLHQYFSAETDPEYDGAHFVGPEDEVRELRNRVTGWLIERPDADAGAALDRLASTYASIERWRRHAVANRDAAQSLKSPKVSVEKIVRLLDDSQFRLIRSADDLQRVLLEELGEIQKSVKEHLSVLYEPPAETGVARKPLREDALQAYLFCRLNDRLPGRVLEPATKAYFINREPLGTKNQRLDIKVEAPTLGGVKVSVVIEIKWVNNREVGTAMRDQLANEYLLGANLTHGIYLVGWGGSHRRGLNDLDIPLARKMCLDAWRSALIRQAREICSEHAELHIESLIMDLEWSLRARTLGVVPRSA